MEKFGEQRGVGVTRLQERRWNSQPASKKKDLPKRYSLVLPKELYDELERVADKRHTTVVDMLRRFVKLGLMAVQIEETPHAALLIREGNTVREIVII
jgi:hypothetical protein